MIDPRHKLERAMLAGPSFLLQWIPQDKAERKGKRGGRKMAAKEKKEALKTLKIGLGEPHECIPPTGTRLGASHP